MCKQVWAVVMRSVIVVHPEFDAVWPFAADHFRTLWQTHGPVEFHRLAAKDDRPLSEVVEQPGTIDRLVGLRVPVTAACAAALSSLREAVLIPRADGEGVERLRAAGARLHHQPGEGAWGQSVAEFALALTLGALRRIPQTHHEIIARLELWDYRPPGGVGQPGARGQQYGDDSRFTSGTLAGKRVRIVGMGNIGSRYASFARMLGADVAAWDPFAAEPAFHRAGARKVWHLETLPRDAEVFAPMLPLKADTEGLVTRAVIDALPVGCLLILVTRARICDMGAVRRRVLADELALAADVFDVEPLPLDDPLLGRHNVVHTPHNAGRTRDANRAWAEALADQFSPVADTTANPLGIPTGGAGAAAGARQTSASERSAPGSRPPANLLCG